MKNTLNVKMFGKFKVLKVSIILSILLVMTFSFFIGIVLLYLRFSKNLEEECFDNREVYYYRFLLYNPEKNETSVGFTTIYEEQARKSFEMIIDEYDNHILLSNFGTEQYKCTGSCFCNQYERRTSVSISRGATYLLTAASTLLAYDLAKEYFQNDCVDKLGDICDMSSIESEVEQCSKVFEETNDETGEYVGLYHNFKCVGICLDVSSDKFVNEILKSSKGGGLPGGIIPDCKKNQFSQEILLVGKYGKDPRGINSAKNRFMKNLDVFCQVNGPLVTVNFDSAEMELSACIGYTINNGGKYMNNPSVKCVRDYSC